MIPWIAPTLNDVELHREELEAEFPGAVLCISDASSKYPRAARHGGRHVHGHLYYYNPTDDSLIRQDVAHYIRWMDRPFVVRELVPGEQLSLF